MPIVGNAMISTSESSSGGGGYPTPVPVQAPPSATPVGSANIPTASTPGRVIGKNAAEQAGFPANYVATYNSKGEVTGWVDPATIGTPVGPSSATVNMSTTPGQIPTYTDENGNTKALPVNNESTDQTGGILGPLFDMIRDGGIEILGAIDKAGVDINKAAIQAGKTVSGWFDGGGGSGGGGGGSLGVSAPTSITSERMAEITKPLTDYKAPTMAEIASRYIGTQDQTTHTLQDLSTAQAPALAESRYIGTQDNAINMLANAASGATPSPAQLMLQAQNDTNVRNMMALAASQSGRSLPAAQRQIMDQAALGGQQAAQQSAILRAQEMIAAQSQYANAAQGARGQDNQAISTMADYLVKNMGMSVQAATAAAQNATAARGQDMSTTIADNEAKLKASGLNLEAARAATGTTAGLTTAERGASSQDYGTGMAGATSVYKTDAEAKTADMQAKAAIIAAGLGAGADIATGLIAKKK